MMRSNSLILRPKRSAVGKAISESSFAGVTSSFSGGRKIVKCTSSTLASARNRLRQLRSPGCGSPETSSTFSRIAHAFDRDAPLCCRAASVRRRRRDFEFDDILAAMLDAHGNVDDVARNRAVGCGSAFAVATHGDRDARHVAARIDDARADDLILADDAKARRLDEFDAAVALALMPGDKRMQRRLEAERLRLRRNVVDDAVGQKDRAADALRRRRPSDFARARRTAWCRHCRQRHWSTRDDARLDVAEFGERGFERLARFVGLRRSPPKF